jgi:hypothetical protein
MTGLEWLIFVLIPSLAWLLALGSSLYECQQKDVTTLFEFY